MDLGDEWHLARLGAALTTKHITKDLNCALIFFADRCIMQDLVIGKRITIGLVGDGLYRFPSTKILTFTSEVKYEKKHQDTIQLIMQ